jgi:hypothetical protein
MTQETSIDLVKQWTFRLIGTNDFSDRQYITLGNAWIMRAADTRFDKENLR